MTLLKESFNIYILTVFIELFERKILSTEGDNSYLISQIERAFGFSDTEADKAAFDESAFRKVGKLIEALNETMISSHSRELSVAVGFFSLSEDDEW